MRLADVKNSRTIIVAVVYLSLFLDNVLLTVVVPIIPDYLCTLDANTTASSEEDENGRVGLLLSSKALVQLILNPAVGTLTGSLGYTRPLFLGNLSLLLAALRKSQLTFSFAPVHHAGVEINNPRVFAFGQTYEVLFLARSIQGIASACIAVSGMSLVASQYAEEDERSKIMGFVLGSIALGVLLGYPIGSVLYDLEGKMAPFLLVSCLIVIIICLQALMLDSPTEAKPSSQQSTWMYLLSNPHILIISGAIWCSTSPMAILEPCLPIWLRAHIKPKKWQLGTVFIPDSVGYLIGTNFFGVIAYRYGRSKVAVLAMFLVGVSAILIPSAGTMSQLIFPHLGMGLGIGVADAALVPLLASLVDRNGSYGPVYSIQQVAVSLAYSLGPIMGGEMVKAIGFPWVMRIVGIVNLAYCPLLIYLTLERRKLLSDKEESKEYDTFREPVAPYVRFQDSDDDL